MPFWCKLDCCDDATNTVDCSPSIAVKQITLLQSTPVSDDEPAPADDDDDDVASDEL